MYNKRVSLDEITLAQNPRSGDLNLDGLTSSIKQIGLLLPLIVDFADDSYVVRSGHRRYAALEYLRKTGVDVPGLDYNAVPCIVLEEGDADSDMIAVASNVHMAMKPSDVGKAMVALAKASGTTNIISIANAFGVVSAYRARLLIDLACAPERVQEKVDSGEMSLSAFSKMVSAPKDVQAEIVGTEGKLTGSKVSDMVRNSSNEYQPVLVPPTESTVQERIRDVADSLAKLEKENPAFSPSELFLVESVSKTATRILRKHGKVSAQGDADAG